MPKEETLEKVVEKARELYERTQSLDFPIDFELLRKARQGVINLERALSKTTLEIRRELNEVIDESWKLTFELRTLRDGASEAEIDALRRKANEIGDLLREVAVRHKRSMDDMTV